MPREDEVPTLRPPGNRRQDHVEPDPERLAPPTSLGTEDDLAQAVAAAFDPRRLTHARHRSAWTKRRLAEAIDVTPTAVTQYERGQARPSASALSRLAVQLGLPVAYFAAGRPLVTVDPTDAHFRSLRSTRAVEREQALVMMAHIAELTTILERVVRLPPVSLPNVQVTRTSTGAATTAATQPAEARAVDNHRRDGPAHTARQLRHAWNLARGPLPHLLRHIETHGVIVATAQFGASDRIDAFSCWVSALGRPVMCLSHERRNVLRRRYNAAHELGHLLMHRRAAPGSALHEREADQFAAELLMPADDMAAVLPHRLDLAQLVELQQQWGVSVQALLRRCHELATINAATYQRGMAAINRLGWRQDEPALDYGGEWPAMLAEALNLARPHGLTEQVLAAGLGLPVPDIREMLGLVNDERPQLQLLATAEPSAHRP